MNTRIRIAGACLVLAGLGHGEVQAQRSGLLLIENLWSENDGVCRERQLVRYRFRGGKVLPKEVLLKREQRFFGHFGGHRLHAKRYVVTPFGGVFDLKKSAVIHDESHGRVLSLEKERVVYQIVNARRESGVFAFEFATQKVTKLGGLWLRPGLRSPDGTATVETTYDGRLVLHRIDAEPRVLAEDVRAHLSMLSSGMPKAPVHWLDDRSILTQTDNGVLVAIGLDGKRAPFLDLSVEREPISSPTLAIQADGTLHYVCGESRYRIDGEKQEARAVAWRPLGHGFQVREKRRNEPMQVFRENGAVIGEWVALAYDAVTAAGRLAVPYAEPKSLGYPKGVKLWNSTEHKWHEIACSVNALVGLL